MTWTTRKPESPGWYWRRDPSGEKEVVYFDGEEVTRPGHSSQWFIEDVDGEFAGPIPEPA